MPHTGTECDGTRRSHVDLRNFLMAQEQDVPHMPTQNEIAVCAYLIWEKENRPLGHEKEHWLQAETQLLACRAHDGWTNKPDHARST